MKQELWWWSCGRSRRRQNVHPRRSGPGGAPCFGQFGDRITISERLAGSLGTTGGCGFPAATRATVGPSEPSSLADLLGPVPGRLVLAALSELLRHFGVDLALPYLLVRRGGSIPWRQCGRSGSVHVGSDGPGPKSVPLLLDQPFPYEVKNSTTGIAKGTGASRMGRLWPLRHWPSSGTRLCHSSSSEK